MDLSVLKNKRIAIVGPADSAYNTGLGDYIDSFDFVVRVNRSPHLVNTGLHAKDIGTKTDLLFHSFFENDESGGGVLDLKMYNKQGLKFLINPRNSLLGYQNTLVFYRKYLKSISVYTLSKSLHRQITEAFGEARPTIGFMALITLLNADFSELYITGFTFYRTDFGPGYRDHIKNKEDAKIFIKNMGIHEIEKEYSVFKKKIDSVSNVKKIIFDKVLNSILENEHS